MTDRRFAGILVRAEGQVALVRETYPAWGGSHWNIPSGRIELGETPADGAVRELREETGLVVPPTELTLCGTVSVGTANALSRSWNFTAEMAVAAALGARDPDCLIEDARWFAVPVAVRLLADLPYRPLSEPAIAVLSGLTVPGTHWAYPAPDRDPVVTCGDTSA